MWYPLFILRHISTVTFLNAYNTRDAPDDNRKMKKGKRPKYLSTYKLDTILDFLGKLGMKPRMQLQEIKHVIVRPTKVIKDLCKAST